MMPTRTRTIVIISAMVLTTLLAPFGSKPNVYAQPGAVYIALGDSIAAGVGSSLPRVRGYAAVVAERYRQFFGSSAFYENLAVPGETASSFITDGQLDRYRSIVADMTSAGVEVRAVSVTLGGNEMLALEDRSQAERQSALDAFTGSFRDALTSVRNELGPETTVVVTTYYDLSDGDPAVSGSDAWWIVRFNDVIRQTAADLGVIVADVTSAFSGRIAELTLAPVDVHPSNAGHQAIADTVWAALAVDTTPPTVTTPDEIIATRSTPTLRFSVTDDGGAVQVMVRSDDAEISDPTEETPGEFVSLVRLGDGEQSPVAATITAVDDAGNRTEQIVTITAAFAESSREP